MKKYSLSIIAVLLAVGLSAFSMKSKTIVKNSSQKYFIYTAYPSNTSADLNNPANYTPTTNDGQDQLVCSGTGKRCGVYATDDGSGEPVLSGATIFQRQ